MYGRVQKHLKTIKGMLSTTDFLCCKPVCLQSKFRESRREWELIGGAAKAVAKASSTSTSL